MASNFSASFSPSNSFRRLLPSFGRFFPVSFFPSGSLIQRLWSFDSSNDPNRTTAETNHSSPLYAENQIPRAMEMGSPTAADPEQDSKRVKNLVLTVSLAVAALCFGIYASIPPEVQLHPQHHSPFIYNSLIAFVSLGVVTSVGLFTYFFVRPEGAEVAWVQKKGVGIAIVFFLIAFVLRIALLLPLASFGYVWLVFFLVTAAIALFLYAGRKKGCHGQIARSPDYRLPIALPPTDGGGN